MYVETPKAELHLHLRGLMNPELFHSQIYKYGTDDLKKLASERHLGLFEEVPTIAALLNSGTLPTEEEVKTLYKPRGLREFLITYLFSGYFFRESTDLTSLIDQVDQYLRSQNITYAEITISPNQYIDMGIPPEALKAALEHGSSLKGSKIRWLIDPIRDRGPEEALSTVRLFNELEVNGLVGLSLAGGERSHPAKAFRPAFEEASRAGLGCTIHAGEASGPEGIWDAINNLPIDRIGHGASAIEDPNLVEHLSKTQIPLEVCPTANVICGVCSSYLEHPVRKLYNGGVAITVNTDDPMFFGITLSEELSKLSDLGFSQEEIEKLIQNSFSFAFQKDS